MAETTQSTYDTVIGYFPDEQSAESAVRELRAAGFERTQIGLAGRPATSQPIAGSDASYDTTNDKAYKEGHKAGESVGGFWQSIKDFFEGHSAEPYADEDTRGDLATHEISNEYDYERGDFHRSLGGLSVPENRSRYFSDRFGQSSGGVLVTVMAGARRVEAEAILEDNGADLGNDTGSETSHEAYEQGADTSSDQREAQRIHLYGEVLRVHRDRVQRGEVRLRKETVTEDQTVQVPVSREELVLERVPVSGEQTAPGASIGEESEVRIPLSEDRVSIEKEPVLREDVRVGKREVTSVESRDEKVRREELKVDDDSIRKAS